MTLTDQKNRSVAPDSTLTRTLSITNSMVCLMSKTACSLIVVAAIKGVAILRRLYRSQRQRDETSAWIDAFNAEEQRLQQTSNAEVWR
jgi:hypothetical protein